GFNDFIAKPIELSILDRVIKTWLPQELIRSVKYDTNSEETNTVAAVESDSFRQLINTEKALTYAGNNQNSYYEVLYSYYEKGPEYKRALEDYFTQQDWHNYVIGVHALKSSSLSVGAEHLSELAKALELAGKAGEYQTILDGHEEVVQLYGRVLAEIEKYLETNGYFAKRAEESKEASPGELREINRESFEEYMEQIRTACDNFDEEGIVSAAEELCSCSLNGTALKEYFAEVKKLAGDFEYDQALEAANKAAEEIMRVLG
ncbi:MAG: Hpt domain-containing protein, partial [Lachnospiraceae bacterium]|nr:Hpt domain-containing protein [Lachnospiraceae bacterium]